MKRFVFLPCFLCLASLASARSIPLARGGAIPIPDQAVVSSEGITFVRPGDPAPFTLKWQDVDLKRLAKQDAVVESNRQKALLTGEKTILGPEAPKLNPYAEFLASPIKVTFRPKETHQSRIDYNSVTTAVPSVDPATGLSLQTDRNGNRVISVAPIVITNGVVTNGQPMAPGFPAQTVTSASTTRSDTTINTTRPPLDTTTSEFLELISDDTRASTGNLIRELREHPDVFTGLIANLRELQSQTPDDPAPTKAIQAVQLISRNGSVPVGARRQLAKFVQHAQSRSTLR